jgi:hypothetical protein
MIMKKTISLLFVLFLLTGTSFAAEKEATVPGEGEVACSGTLTINVDNGSIIETKSLSGELNECVWIRKISIEDGAYCYCSEGSYSVSSSGCNFFGVEDSSPHDIMISYEPTSTTFSITIYITTGDPTTYGEPDYCK